MSGKPMDPDRLAAFRSLAEKASLDPGRTIAHTVGGRVSVSVFVDGRHDETIVADVGKDLVRASMLAFDGHDLRELLGAHEAAADEIRGLRPQRDDARRELCEALGALRGVGWSGRHIAVERGWGYLYPEPVAVAADERRIPTHDEITEHIMTRWGPVMKRLARDDAGDCDACGDSMAADEVETDLVDCGDTQELARVHARCRGIL